MIKNKALNITILTIFLSTMNSFASASSTVPETDSAKLLSNTDNTSQKTIDDFYAYAGSIKPEIRDEIRKYREEIVAINKKKRDLYNSLSQEAQSFLAEQQKYKEKISISKDSQKNSPFLNNSDKDKSQK
ncbi:hypothetical protein [Rickettsia endosymbiont of Halotydeus destructor]|uniref:hypothetical protein n=1 Tax=Rickettsia endosymbiont of Halotydeus destructor TaxID=2996754 RepID=UPI003BAEE465